MGKLFFKIVAFCFFSGICLTKITTAPAHAQTNQQCVANISNPAPPSEVLPYGAPRTATRVHRGVDIMLDMCLVVNNQPGCTIMMNGTSPLWRTGGYGLYARYNCGPRVEVRYTHLNGWKEGRPVNGRSGAARPTPPHIHYEVLVDRIRVDPECVWGTHDNPSVCPSGLGVTPADMCNDSVLEALKQNAFNRYTDKPVTVSGMGVDNSISIKPSQVGPGPFSEDLPGCPESDPEHEQDVEHEHDGFDDLEADPLPTIQPPPYVPYEKPPIEPPLPPNPGEPTGDPNLTPPPEDGANIPENVTGCAADTWTAMVNQAVMQTRRQDLVNKRLIVKPDSILDYSCFSAQYARTANDIAPIFSETMRWDNIDVDLIGDSETIQLKELDDENEPLFSEVNYHLERDYTQSNGTEVTYERFSPLSLDMALDAAVTASITPYLENNFLHGFLADSVPVSGADISTCNVMNQVWQASKCKNIGQSDVFFTFEKLVTSDPREFPVSMPCF